MKIDDVFQINEYPNHPTLSIMAKRLGGGYGSQIVVPFDLLPELIRTLEAHLTKRALDGAWACPKCGRDNKKGGSRCWHCFEDAPRK